MKRREFTAALTLSMLAGANAGWAQDAEPKVEDTMTDDSMAHEGIVEMVLGDENAPITVIEYASYTCPHCANFHHHVFGDLKANYIDTGKVKFIYREVYFDKFGLWASMLARCGGADRFFGISDVLYNEQRDWLASNVPADVIGKLRTIGLKAGIEGEELDACFGNNDFAKELVTWYKEKAGGDGVRSTPSFIINGKLHSNMNYEEFSETLDDLL